MATKKDNETLADAVEEEAKPDAKIDTSPDGRNVASRPNDTPINSPQSAPLGGNSTLASRRNARLTGQPADVRSDKKANPNNTTLAERANARNKRVKPDQVASK